jgi:hypothetical protein
MITGRVGGGWIEPREGEGAKSVRWHKRRALVIAKLHEEIEEIARQQSNQLECGGVLSALFARAALNGIAAATEIGCRDKRDRRWGFDIGWLISRIDWAPFRRRCTTPDA